MVWLYPGLYSPLWALVGFIIVIFLIYWLVSAFELWHQYAYHDTTSRLRVLRASDLDFGGILSLVMSCKVAVSMLLMLSTPLAIKTGATFIWTINLANIRMLLAILYFARCRGSYQLVSYLLSHYRVEIWQLKTKLALFFVALVVRTFNSFWVRNYFLVAVFDAAVSTVGWCGSLTR